MEYDIDNNCIYVHKDGFCRGLRCGNDIGPNGYCDEHREIGMIEVWPKICLGLSFNSTYKKWIKCTALATIDGYCNKCILRPESESQLKSRCAHRMKTGTHIGQRCYRKAERNGYCLHCIYNNVGTDEDKGAEIKDNDGMDTLVNTFSHIDAGGDVQKKRKTWGQWIRFWRR